MEKAISFNTYLHPDLSGALFGAARQRPAKKAGTEGGKGAQIIIGEFPKTQYLCTSKKVKCPTYNSTRFRKRSKT